MTNEGTLYSNCNNLTVMSIKPTVKHVQIKTRTMHFSFFGPDIHGFGVWTTNTPKQ